MKVIIVGASGFIDHAVLQLCLETPEITSIILLARRELSRMSDPKVATILHSNFASYPDELLKQLAGASACIWCMGIPLGKAGSITDEASHAIEVDYPLVAARAFSRTTTGTFRFVYTSGRIAERDKNKTLWVLAHARRMKGEAERALLALTESTPNLHIALTRPAGVYSPIGIKSFMPCLPGISMFGISVDELAAFDVDVALGHGLAGADLHCGEVTYGNAEMVKRGRSLLA